jgi:hypothetical protein
LAEYTVYEPRIPAADPVDRAEQLVFVKDGFHWWAAILPALWLIVKGLWLELLVCLVVVGALTSGLDALGVNGSVGGTLLLIAQLVFGFEAGTIQSAALERRGWRQVGYVEGRNLADSERRFFADWLPSQSYALAGSYAEPMPKGPVAAFAETAMRTAKDAAFRWRQPSGDKA